MDNKMDNKVDNYIETFTGIKFDFLNPKLDQIDIEDIAHSLSMQVRYTGHCSKFYSIAEHCLLVSYMCSDEFKLYGLLHDASEAYLTDVASPIKPFLQNYKMMECKVMNVITEKYGLGEFFPEEVHLADMNALRLEITQLMSSKGEGWAINNVLSTELPDIELECMGQEEAKERFLQRFYELTTNE